MSDLRLDQIRDCQSKLARTSSTNPRYWLWLHRSHGERSSPGRIISTISRNHSKGPENPPFIYLLSKIKQHAFSRALQTDISELQNSHPTAVYTSQKHPYTNTTSQSFLPPPSHHPQLYTSTYSPSFHHRLQASASQSDFSASRHDRSIPSSRDR